MGGKREITDGIFCRFSAGLDDLTRKQQGDVAAVLAVLKRTGRYSAFEATASDTLARMMTRLHHKGCVIVRDGVKVNYGKLIESTGGDYPWTEVRLTEAGEQLLAVAA